MKTRKTYTDDTVLHMEVEWGVINRAGIMGYDYLEYKGTAPLKKGEKVVWIDEDDAPYRATVHTLLACQCVIEIEQGKIKHHRYIFYSDKGYRWHVWSEEWAKKVEAAEAARDTKEREQAQGQEEVQQEGEEQTTTDRGVDDGQAKDKEATEQEDVAAPEA